MERQQFTFYRSYWEGLRSLPKKDRLAAFEAICSYALDEIEPEITGAAATAFILIRPTLDTGRKRAASGKTGGEKQPGAKAETKPKQTASKTEAKPKQTQREIEGEREKEIEGEIEVEIEDECLPPIVPLKGDTTVKPEIFPRGFEAFWAAYPRKVGKQDALKSYQRALKKTSLETMLAALEAQKQSQQWQRDNGQYIPHPSTWLNQGRWDDEVQEAKPAREIGNVFLRLAMEGVEEG